MKENKDEKLLKILKSNIIDYAVVYGDKHEMYNTATITIQVKAPKEFTEEMAMEEIHYTPCKSISDNDFELIEAFLREAREESLEYYNYCEGKD